MSLKGNLQSVDLANVLQMLSLDQKEGTLVLFDGDTRKSIYFSRDGVSMLSRGRRGQDSLGRILLRHGRITREALDAALARQKSEGKRLGEILGEMAAVSREDVEAAVRTQIQEEIHNLFIWKEASFEFIEGPPPAVDNAPMQVTFDVNSLITEAQRRAEEWNFIRGLVPALDEIYKPTVTLDQANVTDEVFLLPYSARILELLRQGRLNVHEIIEDSCAAKFEACKMLALLLDQGAIEPVSIADLQALSQDATGRNDHPEAAKFLSRIVELGGATPPVNMQLGYALEALQEPERASLFLKAAAESYVELVEPAHAFEAYNRVVMSLPTDLQAVTQMVEIACRNPEVFSAHSQEVLEAGRTLAGCQKELGRLPAALQILHSLAQSTPGDLPLRSLLVQAYQESGMNNEAMAELESMAGVCSSRGEHDEAIRCLRKITAIDRNRPGVLKKIEAIAHVRDRGKRIGRRIAAAAGVVAILGAAAGGLLWYKGSKERHRTEIEKTISEALDSLSDDFTAAEKRFAAASDGLERYADGPVEDVARGVAELNAASRGMDDARAAVENRARAILAEHSDACEPTENLVERRTASMRRGILESGLKTETHLKRIVDGAQALYRKARKEAEHHPVSSIPSVERAVGLLTAVGAGESLEVPVDDRVENAAETLKQLHRYREELEGVQGSADEAWAAGKRTASRDLLAEYLATFPSVTEFRERLGFRVRVTTVPSGAHVQVLGAGADQAAGPSPREILYTAAAGLRFEVTAPGFQARTVEIPPLPDKFDAKSLRDRLPAELPVVLSKIPLWTRSIATGALEAAPVPTPDGKSVVVPDRAGWIHLVTVEDGVETASYDAGSLSGFPAAALVAGTSVYAASLDGVVVALDLPGLRERWKIPAERGPGPVVGRPVLVGGLLVAAGTSGLVKAFRAADGEPAWEVRLTAGTLRDLALVGGRIVVLCDDGTGRILSADGKEVLPLLTTSVSQPSYSAPSLGPVPAGTKVLLALGGTGREVALVEPPNPGSSGDRGSYRWGVSLEGAEPVGVVLDGESLLVVFNTGMARLATLSRGVKPGSLPFRVFGEKETALGSPAFDGGVHFQATNLSLSAFRLKGAEVEEIWKWNDSEGSALSTPLAVAGRFIVVGTRDGKLHGLLRD